MSDELTGLATLAEFHRTLEREFEYSGTSQGRVALVLLQLEDFELGSTGVWRGQADAVLVGVAGVLRYLTRASCEVARWDGGNFGVVLPGSDHAEAVALAQRVRAELEEVAVPCDGDELRVKASLGVASAPADARDKDGLLSAAEEALRRARGRGH